MIMTFYKRRSRIGSEHFLVDLITNDDFEKTAFHVQVLKALKCSCELASGAGELESIAHDEFCACKDGGSYKLVSDDEASITAVFTKESIEKAFAYLTEEGELIPDFNRSLIIIRRYDVLFMPSSEQAKCKFQLHIDEFVLRVTREGFFSKLEMIDCHDIPEVRTKLNSVWNIWRTRLESDGTQDADDTLHSICLTQLLEQMDIPTSQDAVMDIPLSQGSIQDIPVSQEAVSSTSQEKRAIAHSTSTRSVSVKKKRIRSLPSSLSNIFTSECLIVSSADQEILDSLEEWKHCYKPPGTVSTLEDSGLSRAMNSLAQMEGKESAVSQNADNCTSAALSLNKDSPLSSKDGGTSKMPTRCATQSSQGNEDEHPSDDKKKLPTSPADEKNGDDRRITRSSSRMHSSSNSNSSSTASPAPRKGNCYRNRSPTKSLTAPSPKKDTTNKTMSPARQSLTTPSPKNEAINKTRSPTKLSPPVSNRQLRSQKRQRPSDSSQIQETKQSPTVSNHQLRSQKRQRLSDSSQSQENKRKCNRDLLDEVVTDASPSKMSTSSEKSESMINPANIAVQGADELNNKDSPQSQLIDPIVISSDEHSDKSRLHSMDELVIDSSENEAGPMMSTQLACCASQQPPSFDEWLEPQIAANTSPSERNVDSADKTRDSSSLISPHSTVHQRSNNEESSGSNSTSNVGQYLHAIELSISPSKSPVKMSRRKKLTISISPRSSLNGSDVLNSSDQHNKVTPGCRSPDIFSPSPEELERVMLTATQPFSVQNHDKPLVIPVDQGQPITVSCQSPPGIISIVDKESPRRSVVGSLKKSSNSSAIAQATRTRQTHKLVPTNHTLEFSACGNSEQSEPVNDRRGTTVQKSCNKNRLSLRSNSNVESSVNCAVLGSEASVSDGPARLSPETPVNSLPSHQPQETNTRRSHMLSASGSDDSALEKSTDGNAAMNRLKELLRAVNDSASPMGQSLLSLQAPQHIICKYKDFFAQVNDCVT